MLYGSDELSVILELEAVQHRRDDADDGEEDPNKQKEKDKTADIILAEHENCFT